jgi:hypothetical protein
MFMTLPPLKEIMASLTINTLMDTPMAKID